MSNEMMTLTDEVKLLINSIGMGWVVSTDPQKAADLEVAECVTVTSKVGMRIEIYRGKCPDVRGVVREVFHASHEWDDDDLFSKPTKWSRRNTIFDALVMLMSASFDRVADSFVDPER